jgi:hypothetical protein
LFVVTRAGEGRLLRLDSAAGVETLATYPRVGDNPTVLAADEDGAAGRDWHGERTRRDLFW